MKAYFELTRKGRLRRMKQLAQTALAAYGLDDARLTFIQYTQNTIYRVDAHTPLALNLFSQAGVKETDDPYVPGRYLLRIHAMGDEEAIASELAWLSALNQEAGLPVPAPVPTLDGKLLTRITHPGLPAGRVVSLMRWLDGKVLSQGFQPKHLQALGQAMARLHEHGASWKPPSGFTRFHWDWEALLGGSMFEYSMEELVGSIPSQYQEPFQAVSQEAKQAMEALGKGPQAYGMVHADLYPENVLFKAGKAYPIDFEDCGYGYWIWDIAIALGKWAWNDGWEPMRDAYREGYAQVRTLPEAQWAMLDLFIATQFATMILWASAFLKQDPLRAVEFEAWQEENGNQLLRYFERAQS